MAKILAGPAFQALGDANRRAIVGELGKGERSVVELSRRRRISQPAVSRHLRLWREAGLGNEEPMGTKHRYHLRDEGVEAARAYFEKVWGDAAARFRLAAANTSSPRSTRK